MARMTRLPYPGLRAFDRDEADLFFGRDGAVDQMIDKLAETRFLSVLGSSGSGKSSLVRTGLLDGLDLGLHPAGADWDLCLLTPGGAPFTNLAAELIKLQAPEMDPDTAADPMIVDILAATLRQGPRSLIEWFAQGYLPPTRNLLVLVDQFEELFRFGNYSDREDAEAFVKLLIQSATSEDAPIHVVMTMRSEFLGACALIPGLAEIINRGTYLTPRMLRQNCREAIVGPVRLSGGQIEDALVNRLLNDMMTFAPWDTGSGTDRLKSLSRRADQLPMMQHVLNRLWRDADEHGHLTLENYIRLGGLDGALDAHGAELLSNFDQDTLPVVAAVFSNLVDGMSTETATRRPMRYCDLVAAVNADETVVRRIVELFRSEECSFLRPGPKTPLQDDTIVDISHESLIRQWSQLREWVIEEGSAAASWRRLSSANKRYRSGEGGLLVGLDLANLASWWHRKLPTVEWSRRYSDDYVSVAEFLRKSEKAAIDEAEAEAEKDRRNRNRLLIALGTVSALAFMASAAAWWGFDQQRAAKELTEAAEGVAEELALGLFNRMDEGHKVPINTAYALIQDREKALDRMADNAEMDGEIARRRIELLIRSTDALLSAKWIDEAADRGERLENLIAASPEDFVTAGDQLKSLMMQADIRYNRHDYSAAKDYIARAEVLLEAADKGDLVMPSAAYLQARAQIDYLRYYMASDEIRVVEALAAVDKLSELSESVRLEYGPRILEEQGTQGLGRDLRNALARVFQYRVHATFSAMTGAYDLLDLTENGRINADQIHEELKDDFKYVLALLPEGSDQLRTARTHYLTSTSDYLRKKEDLDVSSTKANEAVNLAEALLTEDPGSNTLVQNLLGALYARAQVSIELENFAQARMDAATMDALILGWSLRDRSTYQSQLRFLRLRDWLDFSIGENVSDVSLRSKASAQVWRNIEVMRNSEPSLVLHASFLPWMALKKDTELARSKDELRSMLRWALDAYNPEGQNADDLVYRLARRSGIFTQLAANDPDLIGADEWETLVRQGVEEAVRLQDLSPESDAAKTTRAYLNGSLILKSASPADERRKLALDTLDFILELHAGPKERPAQLRNGTIYARKALELLEVNGDFDANLRRVESFFEEVLTSEKALEAFVGFESFLTFTAKDARNHAQRFEAAPHPASSAQLQRLEDIATSAEEAIARITAENSSPKPLTDTEVSAAFPVVQTTDLRSIKTMAEQVGEVGRMNWTFVPAYPGNWRTLDRSETEELFRQSPDLARAVTEAKSQTFYVRETTLPFYTDGRLVEIEAVNDNDVLLLSFLVFPDRVVSLAGTSPEIHKTNAEIGVRLETPSQAGAYLRFFCLFVNGDEGAFRIVEHVEELQFENGTSADTVSTAQTSLRPLTMWPDPEEPDHWRATATINYSNAVYYAQFRIMPSGMVEMLDDRPILADLPLKPFRIQDLRAGSSLRTELDRVDVERFGMTPVTGIEGALKVTVDALRAQPENGNIRAVLDRHLDFLADPSVLKTNELSSDKINEIVYPLIRDDISVGNATKALETAVSGEEVSLHSGSTLALGYLRTNRVEEAAALLESVTNLPAEKSASERVRAEVWALKVQAYRRQGKHDEAKEALAIALGFKADAYWAAFIDDEARALAGAQ